MVGSPDFATVATNVAVFMAAIGAAAAGSLVAVKSVKDKYTDLFDKPSDAHNSKVVGGMLMDNTSLLMWSESMRDLKETIEENTKEIRLSREEKRELRHEMALDREIRRNQR